MKSIASVLLCCFLYFYGSAQRGLPPKPVVNINHTTNYAQHIDFAPSMVSKLKLPAGWSVKVAATGLGKPRMMAVGSDQSVYITRREAGDVLRLTDTDGDKVFDKLQTVVSDFSGVHGIVIKDGSLYLCSNRILKRFALGDDGMVKGMGDTLIKDLPDGGQHGNRTMAFGPDGYLYLSVGSTCNDCMETNKENATLLRINPADWSRTIYAKGLRNTIGFDWHPVTKDLYGIDNGGDAKGENWPPEELNMIQEDKDYGWPLVYAKQVPDETREDPPGSTKAAYAKTTAPSLLEFTAHMAPIDFKFLGNDALICWHGSWNKKQPVGFKVQKIRFENGKPVKAEDFLSGFLSADGRSRFGRPAGLAVTPEGNVYVSDDANGIIYFISKN
jgi:glucose/arabinose dehydrogenase